MRNKAILTNIAIIFQLIVYFLLLISFPAKADNISLDLIRSAASGDTETMQNLIAKGADIDALDEQHWTALMWAAKGGHTDTVKAILAEGGNINIKNLGGFTALMYASIEGHTEIVKLLQVKKADNQVNNFGAFTNPTNEKRTELTQEEKILLYTKAKKRREAIRAKAINRARERFNQIY